MFKGLKDKDKELVATRKSLINLPIYYFKYLIIRLIIIIILEGIVVYATYTISHAELSLLIHSKFFLTIPIIGFFISIYHSFFFWEKNM